MLIKRALFGAWLVFLLTAFSLTVSAADQTDKDSIQAGILNYLLERQKQSLSDDFINEYAQYLTQQVSISPYVASILPRASYSKGGKPYVDLGMVGDARFGARTSFAAQGLKELIESIQLADPLANAMFYNLWGTSFRPDDHSLPADIESMLREQRPSGAGSITNIALIDGNAMISDLIRYYTAKDQRRASYRAADAYRDQLGNVYFIKAEYFPENGDTQYTEMHWFWHEAPPDFWQDITKTLVSVDFNRVHDKVNLPPAYVMNIEHSSGSSLRFTEYGLLKIDDAYLNAKGFESELYTPSVKVQSLLGYGMVQPLRNSRDYFLYFNDFINAYSERCSSYIQNRMQYTTRVDQVTTQGGVEIGRTIGKEHTIYIDERYLNHYKSYTQRLTNMVGWDLFQLLSRGQNQEAISAGISLMNRKNRTVDALLDKGCNSEVVQVIYHNMLHETRQVAVDASLRY